AARSDRSVPRIAPAASRSRRDLRLARRRSTQRRALPFPWIPREPCVRRAALTSHDDRTDREDLRADHRERHRLDRLVGGYHVAIQTMFAVVRRRRSRVISRLPLAFARAATI